jgi:hypothetical protein
MCPPPVTVEGAAGSKTACKSCNLDLDCFPVEFRHPPISLPIPYFRFEPSWHARAGSEIIAVMLLCSGKLEGISSEVMLQWAMLVRRRRVGKEGCGLKRRKGGVWSEGTKI